MSAYLPKLPRQLSTHCGHWPRRVIHRSHRDGVQPMPNYVIEKSIPGLGQLSAFQRDQTVRRGCSALHGVLPDVE